MRTEHWTIVQNTWTKIPKPKILPTLHNKTTKMPLYLVSTDEVLLHIPGEKIADAFTDAFTSTEEEDADNEDEDDGRRNRASEQVFGHDETYRLTEKSNNAESY